MGLGGPGGGGGELVKVGGPPAWSWSANVPAPSMFTWLKLTLVMELPSTHWMASYEESSRSVSVTLIVPVMGAFSASNHSAPTPKFQFGSRLPARSVVSRAIVVVPAGGTLLTRLARGIPPPLVCVPATPLSVPAMSCPP